MGSAHHLLAGPGHSLKISTLSPKNRTGPCIKPGALNVSIFVTEVCSIEHEKLYNHASVLHFICCYCSVFIKVITRDKLQNYVLDREESKETPSWHCTE